MQYNELKNELIFKDFDAKKENLQNVSDYVTEMLEEKNADAALTVMATVMLEEIFVNIASYAYVGTEYENDPKMQLGTLIKDGFLYMVFIDKGIEFNPLLKKDPDLEVSVEEKPIGGMGIYMVKQWANEIAYERIDNQNILMVKKQI